MRDLVLRDGPHGALIVRFTAASRRNSLRLDTIQALSAALDADLERTVVVGSETRGVFCSGADLKIADEERADLSDRLYALYEQIITRPGVVIALVDGPAVGGGAQLATAADLRIVTPLARFRWVGPGHGLAVGAWILPELVGRAAALELALTSRWIGADEAVRLGLATSVVDPAGEPVDALEAHLDATLASLALGQSRALGRVKRIALGDLVGRLRAERRLNHAAWDGHAAAPSSAPQ